MWSGTQVRALLAAYGLSGLLLALSWYRIGGTPDLGTQSVWLELGIGSLMLAAAATCIWVLGGRRTLHQRALPLWGALREVVERQVPVEVDMVSGLTSEDTVVVVAPGVHLFHRSGCALTSEKSVRGISPTAEGAEGLRPCGVCRP